MEGGERTENDNSDMDLVHPTLQHQHSDNNINNGQNAGGVDQVMVDQGDDDTTNTNSTRLISGNQHQLEELVTPKLKEKNVKEMNHVLNSAEVLISCLNLYNKTRAIFLYTVIIFSFITQMTSYDESGTPADREAFMKELENFYRERSLEFKPPKFYGVPLNCLKYV